MRSKNLLVLVFVTAAVIAAAAYALKKQNAMQNASLPGPTLLFPKLLAEVNQVGQITVATAKTHLTIRREGPGHWVIGEKSGYPASLGDVKKAVVGLAQVKRLEPRTADPKLYKDIGVSSLKTPGSKAIEIALANGKGKPIAALLVGNTQSFSTGIKPGTFYVRKPGQKRSWLASGQLDNLKPDLLLWIKSTVLNIPHDRMKEVEIGAPDAHPIMITRKSPEAARTEVSGLPQHAKPDLSTAGKVTTALEYLSVEDVAKPEGWGFAKAPVTTFRTFDGLVIKARTVKHDGKDWVKFAVSYDGPVPSTAAGTVSAGTATAKVGAKGKAGAKAKTAPALLKSPAAAEKESKDLAAALNGWAFQVASYHAAYFTETAAELTAKPPAKSKSGS